MTNENIVERLLAMHPHMAVHGDQICATAANEIRALRTREREAQDRYKATEDELRATEAKLARVERRNVALEEALKPFADEAAEDDGVLRYDFSMQDHGVVVSGDLLLDVTYRDFMNAYDALQYQETDDA